MTEQQDFLKKREQFAINIRKQNREQVFQKRRNLDSFLSKELESSQNKVTVIDFSRQQEIKKINKMRFTIQMLPELFSAIYDGDTNYLHYGIIGMRKIICEINQMIDANLAKGIPEGMLEHLPKLVECMRQEQYLQVRLEATWIVANLASGGQGWCQKIVEAGCVEVLVKLLKECDRHTFDHAIYVIGNLSADHTSCRDYILEQQGLTLLIDRLEEEASLSVLSIGAWAVSNLSRGTPSPPYERVKPALPFFCLLLKQSIIKDAQIESSILWSINSITEKVRVRLKPIIEYGIITELFQYSISSVDAICIPALRILGNFSTGNTFLTGLLLNNNILDVSLELLNRPKKEIRREVGWILSNIAAGVESEVDQFLIRLDVINKLLNAFLTDISVVKRQIAWIFANFTQHGNPQKLLELYLTSNIFKYFQMWLQEEVEPKNIENCLRCLKKILQFEKEKIPSTELSESFKTSSIPKKLREFQNNNNERVRNLTLSILSKYEDELF